jgi:predicted transcriptional regulator YheO
MLPAVISAQQDTGKPPEDEKSFQDIDELARHLLTEAIDASGAPVDLVQKRHKIAVVSDLKDRGFFMLRESVEMAAQALQVTRFTVYNYLNELGNEQPGR